VIAWALSGELFMHLWFLWHLCWLAVALAVTALIVRTIGVRTVPRFLVATPLCLVALIPLSSVTQGWQANFGPDTSASLVPAFHVLAHYAVFFGFGALMFCVPSAADRLGRAWWAYLPLAALACFAALRLTHDPSAFAGRGIDGALGAKLAPWLQSVFVWCTSLGLMGLARTLLRSPNPRVRYISDASYWLYVAHLPVVLAGQFALAYVPLPPLVEFAVLTVGTTALMLATYRWWVRGTWVGVLLNGVRIRPGSAQATAQSSPTNPETGGPKGADMASQSPAAQSQPRLEGANL
jgi:peptidoglycan/LPS O-acetylase OafA/YrhL